MSDASELAAGIADTLTGVRRVIQLTPVVIHDEEENEDMTFLYALCSDGTMWYKWNESSVWDEIDSVPQP